MALMIECPNCGRRPYTEYWFEGETPEPERDATETPTVASLRADYERVWLRRNDAGVQEERWFHFAGCRRMLTVLRDTRTNEIHGVS
jgi:heterotetrameric sarcosine oxidase delta subunit